MPDYPKLAQLWWQNIAEAVTGEKTPQEAMDNLAKQQDQILARLERAGHRRRLRAQAQPGDSGRGVVRQPGAPKPKLANEKPQGETVPYDQLLQAWKEGRVRSGDAEGRAPLRGLPRPDL